MWLLKIFKITDKSYVTALSKAGVIGMHMVSGIIVGALIGYGLDRWLDTSPICTGLFLLLGVIAGFKNVYVDTKHLLAIQREEDAERFGTRPPDTSGKDAAPDAHKEPGQKDA